MVLSVDTPAGWGFC